MIMSIPVAYNNHLAFPDRPVKLNLPAVELKTPALHCELVRNGRLSLKTAASSSFTGSGAEYSEPLSTTQKKKARKIAGIDQDELVDPKLLADPDSCFCEFKGLQLHHKICDPETEPQDSLHDETISNSSHQTEKLKFPLILLHGFGASLFSWNAVMKRLANVSGSKVLSFDRPAFGLTTRVDNPSNHAPAGSIQDTKPLNPYSMAFSVLATLYFIDFLAAEKAILVGHSAGCLVAAQTYFQAPERVAAMILVAPAIVAPFIPPKKVKANNQEDESNADNIKNPFLSLLSIVSKFSRCIARVLMSLLTGMVNMVNSLYKKALSAFFRSSVAVMLVRMVIGKFGISAVKNAWYDTSKVTDNVLEAYTRPLRAKGWDRALVEFTAEMLASASPESNPPLPESLSEISCPVLIITGDSDRLVPSWNAVRLSQAIPGSHLEVIKKCGHLPHEETPEEFVTIVDNFLNRVFRRVESQPLQAAT
ncbi:putative 2-hydroxy-6-oxonona-2,4-dienedioate hydrolase [Helianthus debilis subsp. tardiflorus]